MVKKKYHDYVFDVKNKKFVGKFDEMYKAEKSGGFDSWEQDDLNYLDKQICMYILREFNSKSILDIGCGKGMITSQIQSTQNIVVGLDKSKQAISIASNRYDNIEFVVADIQKTNWINVLKSTKLKNKNGSISCISCLEILSYISNWRNSIEQFSKLGEYLLIKIYLPPNPVGFIKSKDEFIEWYGTYYNIINLIDLVSDQTIILFGKSKAIGDYNARV